MPNLIIISFKMWLMPACETEVTRGINLILKCFIICFKNLKILKTKIYKDKRGYLKEVYKIIVKDIVPQEEKLFTKNYYPEKKEILLYLVLCSKA